LCTPRVPLAVRLRDRRLGPAVLLAVQRALCQLADAAHARAVLRNEVLAEVNAHRIVLGGLRGLAVLERDPLAAHEAASALLMRLKGRLARLPVCDDDDDDVDDRDNGDDSGLGGAPSQTARAVVRTLASAVRIVDEAAEEEGSAEEEEGGDGETEDEVPAGLRRGGLSQDARQPLKAALATVDRAAVEEGLLLWVQRCLGPLLPLRHTQVKRAFDARAASVGGRVGQVGPDSDDQHGDEEVNPSAAVGAVQGLVATRRTQEYRRRTSIYALAALRMNGNTHVRVHCLKQCTHPNHTHTRPPTHPTATHPRQAMMNWKLLQRVVAFYGRLPRSFRRREKRLGWNQAAGVAEVWLDKQADEYDEPANLNAKLKRYAGWHEQQ